MVKFLSRYLCHQFKGIFALRRYLSKEDIVRIEHCLAEVEANVSVEIAFAVEEKYSLTNLFKFRSARERAIELFSLMRVWDTTANNGALLYLLLAEKNIELIADRGIAAVLNAEEIESVCREIEFAIQKGNVCEGVIFGIKKLGDLLTQHFPAKNVTAGEVSNKVHIG